MTPESEEQVRRLKSVLRPDGWDVEVTTDGTQPAVALKHALSQPFAFGIGSGNLGATVDAVLASPEVAAIRSAPRDASHPVVIAALRANAKGYGWSSEILGQVAWMLQRLEILTESEATWVETAGTPQGFGLPS